MTWTLRLLLLLACLMAGCASSADSAEWVEAMAHADREAARLERAGNDSAAAAVIEEALARPATGVAAEDARVVRQDLHYRLAALELSRGGAERSRRWATEGLRLGRATDVFTANLLVIRGKAHEALGDASAASVDYHDALIINEALLGQALETE